MDRYICVHGHFYQPPRENPWLEAVEVQDSAYPYHDWNERIEAECYGPNAWARVLNSRGKLVRVVNNYSRMSFNIGPTLLNWMEQNAPATYEAVIEADRQGRERFSGHGPAMAQCYSHMIMPLANARDRRTQVAWGVADFRHRFGREPEGMWLPETAVDTVTLSLLAEYGIKFTVLAPRQALRVRPIGSQEWQDVSGEQIDTTRPYLQRLPGGRSVSVFFYDGPASVSVAFEGLLHDGQAFARGLIDRTRNGGSTPRLVHIATDGETYGHHHRFGEMALVKALDEIEASGEAGLTVYGEFLDRNRPEYEVEVAENSSWSCAHGVERWRAACGCNAGRRPGVSQGWRQPLREAFDWLRDELAPRFESEASRLLRDPWAARDAYISVVLDRSPENVAGFFAAHASRKLDRTQTVRALKLLELQRHAMLMYTSCGWFFDEIADIETVQALRYAGRAVQLGDELFDGSPEAEFVRRLAEAKSNLLEAADGGVIYEQQVRPLMAGLSDVAAHYAISSLFEAPAKRVQVYAFEVVRRGEETRSKASATLATSEIRVKSLVTLEEANIIYGVLHRGGADIVAGICAATGNDKLANVAARLIPAFEQDDFPAFERVFKIVFGDRARTVDALFTDRRREVMAGLLAVSLEQAHAAYADLCEREAPAMRAVAGAGMPVPKPFMIAAEFFLSDRIRNALTARNKPDFAVAMQAIEEAKALGASLDKPGLSHLLTQVLNRALDDFARQPSDVLRLRRLSDAVKFSLESSLQPELWQAQALCLEMVRTRQQEAHTVDRAADGGDSKGALWAEQLTALAELLGVSVE